MSWEGIPGCPEYISIFSNYLVSEYLNKSRYSKIKSFIYLFIYWFIIVSMFPGLKPLRSFSSGVRDEVT